MSLHLDLSGAIAKVARARFHYECYKRKFSRIVKQSNPYSVHIGEIEPDGWAMVRVVTSPTHSNTLGLIAGDAFHNLRSALDYIISALAVASGIPISRNHQFPIYLDEREYRNGVGDETTTLAKGCLRGITHGVRQIWDLQPFHEQPKPETHPLFTIHRFSNADKHRLISDAFYPVYSVSGQIWLRGGRLLEEETFVGPTSLPNGDFEIGRVRLAYPLPKECGFNGEITVKPLLRTPAFGQYAEYTIYGAYVDDLCEFVSKALEVFAAL